MLRNKIINKLKNDYIPQNNLEVIYQILGGDVLEGRTTDKTTSRYVAMNMNGEYMIAFNSPIDLAIYVNSAKYTPVKTWYTVQHDDGRVEAVLYPKEGDKILSVMEGETKWSRNYTMK